MFGLFKKRSTRETGERGFFRACNVYCHPETDKAIVAAVFNHGGLIAEKPGGSVAIAFSVRTDLEAAVQNALAECEHVLEFDYSKSKPSDWPAYQASRCKTFKAFEADFVRLHIRGVNASNHSYSITTPEFGKFALEMSVNAQPNIDQFADAIHYLLRCYRIAETAFKT